MHLSPQILVALVAFAGVPVIEALPVNTSPAPISPIIKEIQRRADYCDGTTWEDQTSLGSPVVSDCLTLADRLGEYIWYIGGSGQEQIAQWGTCAFGVTKLDWRIATPSIGNENVRDLIRGAVQKFQWNSRIGSKGVTSCRWNGGMTDIEWGIYHD